MDLSTGRYITQVYFYYIVQRYYTNVLQSLIAQTPGGYGYDMNYCFASNGGLQQMAILASPKTGRLLEVKSTLPGLQVYTGNWLNTKGKFNVDYVSMINSGNEGHYY